MTRVANILETVGKTPVVRINRLAPAHVSVFVKIEAFNPLGSVKDRLALGIIEDAERTGKLKPGQTVVEATSGNTSIGLAMVCAQKGYPLVVTMAESFSVERRKLMRFLGAKVVITPAADRAMGMVKKAIELDPRQEVLDLDALLRQVARSAATGLGDACLVWLCRPGSASLEPRSGWGFGEDLIEAWRGRSAAAVSVDGYLHEHGAHGEPRVIDLVAEHAYRASSPRSYAAMFHLGGAVGRAERLLADQVERVRRHPRAARGSQSRRRTRRRRKSGTGP